MTNQIFESEFFEYLAESQIEGGEEDNSLPSLNALSDKLGVSVARLREQLEVAKALGLVEVRPRTGIRRLPYSFTPAVWQSLAYAITVEPGLFQHFAILRRQVELAFWDQAVRALLPEDHLELQQLIENAWKKLRGAPVRIPHREHRQLHILIFKRLENPFVLGIIEAFWDAYEAGGLNLYADLNYLEEVWNYHQKIVEAICSEEFEVGYQALVDHTDLLYRRASA